MEELTITDEHALSSSPPQAYKYMEALGKKEIHTHYRITL